MSGTATAPWFVASVRQLNHCFLDEAINVRKAAVGSARAAALEPWRVPVEADDADAFRFGG
jgi:hypothetical protein